jgi:hypothetical protein
MSANVFERMAQEPECGPALSKLSMKDLYAIVRVAREAPLEALRRIADDPHGCRFCDYGNLRNPEKDHDSDCPYLFLEAQGDTARQRLTYLIQEDKDNE